MGRGEREMEKEEGLEREELFWSEYRWEAFVRFPVTKLIKNELKTKQRLRLLQSCFHGWFPHYQSAINMSFWIVPDHTYD
jgi:hypothetical protein